MNGWMFELIIYGESNWPCHVVQSRRFPRISGEELEGIDFRPQYMWYALTSPLHSRGKITAATSGRVRDIW